MRTQTSRSLIFSITTSDRPGGSSSLGPGGPLSRAHYVPVTVLLGCQLLSGVGKSSSHSHSNPTSSPSQSAEGRREAHHCIPTSFSYCPPVRAPPGLGWEGQ